MYVRESQLPQGGEGLYARRDFGVKEVAALYNGIKFKSSTYAADHMPRWGCECETSNNLFIEPKC